MRLATHHLTASGGRRGNQDAIKEVAGDGFALLALADGLGGHGDGALAAHQCVETVAEVFARSPSLAIGDLQALVDTADRAIADLRLEQDKPRNSMRTTLALLAVCGGMTRWAHVGDSRVYWFRDKVLKHRTRDHSVLELVTGLEDGSLTAPSDEADRNRLLRVVGTGAGCRAELGGRAVPLQPGDAFLLCSDGVWSVISDPDIAECLSGAATPLEWCAAIEERLKERFRLHPQERVDDYSMILGMVVP